MIIVTAFLAVHGWSDRNDSSPGPGRREVHAQSAEIPGDFVIELMREPDAFHGGGGPDYRITLNATGRVDFLGVGGVKALGFSTGSVGPEAIRRLVERIEAVRFFDIHAVCRWQSTHGGSITISVTMRTRFKSVERREDCADSEWVRRHVELEAAILRETRHLDWMDR